MEGTIPDDTSELRQAIPVATALGAIAFVVNYAVTFLLVALDGADLTPATTWRWVGIVLFNAHNVAVETTTVIDDDSFNYLWEQPDGGAALTTLIPVIGYQAAPALVLLLAGFIVATRIDVRDSIAGSLAGATVTLGYATLAIVGVFLFRISHQGLDIGPTSCWVASLPVSSIRSSAAASAVSSPTSGHRTRLSDVYPGKGSPIIRETMKHWKSPASSPTEIV